MRKRYEVRGMMEWHPEFRVGRGRLQVSFTGGHLCGGASTPASYETSDPVVQKVIESSAAFSSGRIRVHALAPEVAQTDCASGAAVRMTALHDRDFIFEYSNIEDISDFLQFSKSVPLDRLLSEEDCFREAERQGIVLKKKES